jgi:hypothetical protein
LPRSYLSDVINPSLRAGELAIYVVVGDYGRLNKGCR